MGAALNPDAFLDAAPAGARPSWRERLSNAIGAWTGIGGGRQMLYVTADTLTALRFRDRQWRVVASFRLGAPADNDRATGATAAASSPVPEAFRQWIAQWRGDRLSFLLDSADEEIENDELPNVRGRDRDKVLDRRLKQRFRDAALTTWIVPPGSVVKKDAKTPGMRECTLLVGLRQRNPMVAWIESALAAGARIRTVDSLALRTAPLLRSHGVATTALLASVQPGGLRQTLVHNGEACFTRLQPLETGASWARVAEELDRTVRFLMMTRANLRPLIQAAKVPIVVIGDGIDRRSAGAFSATALPLREAAVPITWLSQDGAAAASAATSAAADTALGGLRHFLATAPGARRDYATAEMRVNERHARSLAAGWAFATLALLTALAANLFIQYTLSGRMDAVGARPRMAAVEATRAQAQQLQQQLARQAVSAEEMDAVVQLTAQLRSRHVDAAQTLRWIGDGLTHDPALNLDEISWEPLHPLAGATALAAGGVPQAVATPAAAAPAMAAPAGGGAAMPAGAAAGPGAASPTLVRISGYVDPAISKELANDKVAALFARLKAGCECTGRILVPPYDPSMDVAYAASPRDSNRVPSPRFTLELERPAPAPVAPDVPASATDLSQTEAMRHG